jgi:hypothetical protein
MSIVLSPDTGIATPSPVVLEGSSSGTITVAAPAVAGSNTQTLAAVTGTLAPIVSGTAVTASGTSVDFTSIPSWVKRITVMFSGVSLSGTSVPLVQLGDSGGVETTGYISGSASARDATATIGGNSTAGFIVYIGNAATNFFYGTVRIEKINGNIWIASISGTAGSSGSPSSNGISGGGNKTVSATLDRIRITTVNGTDTFDAGTINILYE